MFEDPSFFVALSFLGFCLTVYLWQGQNIRQAFLEQIEQRLDPIYRAEQAFLALSDAWHQARYRIEHVSHDVQDIHQHYEEVLERSLLKAKQREEAWMSSRKRDIEAFRVYQKKQADSNAIHVVLDEFAREST